ncbi:hypothetical protein AB3X91_28130 [Paraburkholderia sp. BR14263]|uniref:hypothetical protein n=1 Tax=unclassified Paraburkholderia TaxID=2615204 RepID=UPI0034CD8A08
MTSLDKLYKSSWGISTRSLPSFVMVEGLKLGTLTLSVALLGTLPAFSLYAGFLSLIIIASDSHLDATYDRSKIRQQRIRNQLVERQKELYAEVTHPGGIRFSKIIFLDSGYWALEGPTENHDSSWKSDRAGAHACRVLLGQSSKRRHAFTSTKPPLVTPCNPRLISPMIVWHWNYSPIISHTFIASCLFCMRMSA